MGCELLNGSPEWYAVTTLPKQEERASNNLRAWGVETFVPRIRERFSNPFTGRPTYLTKPMFPRYIFARFDVDRTLHKVSFTRGVSRVVCFGGSPAPVDDEIIEFMKAQTDENGYIKTSDNLTLGDKVIIMDGPLKSFIAVFERQVSESDRVNILLATLNYQGHIVIERDCVQKIS